MDLISGIPVEGGKILDVGDYIDEMGLTIRPVLEVLYELDEDISLNFGMVKNLIFGTLGHWDQINRLFLNHNRSIKQSESAQPVSRKINDNGSVYPMISKLRMVSESLKLAANNMPDGVISGSALNGFVETLDEVGDWMSDQ